MVGDVGEANMVEPGLVLRGGVRHALIDLTGTMELWQRVGDFSVATVLVEATYPLRPRTAGVTPFFLLGVGHAWSSYHGDASRWENLDGTAASIGLGLEWPVGAAWGIRTEGLFRTDDGGQNVAARLLLGWHEPDLELEAADMEGSADAVVYWMVPVSGPWRFVDPGFGFRFSRFRERWGGSLTFAVYHWQIPGDAFLRNYIVDTRAFIAQPAVEWHPLGSEALALRGGPSITLMGEGPGDGASFGGHLETSWSPVWARGLTVGLGWSWMRHDTSDSRYTSADQNGLMLFGGIHLGVRGK